MAPDRFTRAYLGLDLESADSLTVAHAVPTATREVVPRAAAPTGFALRGCVLTPDERIDGGCVVIADGQIQDVTTAVPTGVDVLDTAGVILPGLIDLHGHPEFNVFPAWEPPRLFDNRYQWRGSALYHQLVRDPQNQLLTDPGGAVELTYAEIRALAGGVTAIQGAGNTTTHRESLVRNVDGWIFGQRRARSMIDLPDALTGRDGEQLAGYLKGITAGEVDVLYLHLAEGRGDDPRSAAEFPRLVELGALTPATVLIHGTALTPDQHAQLAATGRGLVWSPQSNLRLYGHTSNVAAALQAGVPLALGADWLPSGSTSLLGEIHIARRELAAQGHPLSAAELVHLVTAGAARIAGLGDRLGTLAAGRPADVLVLERDLDDPYESVCHATPAEVELVVLDGAAAYGRSDWVTQLTPPDADPGEDVLAWGKAMTLHTGPTPSSPTETPGGSLAAARAALIAKHPGIGPIYA